jgi:hypothetical protein
MGGLRQEAVRQIRAGAALDGALHPLYGHRK